MHQYQTDPGKFNDEPISLALGYITKTEFKVSHDETLKIAEMIMFRDKIKARIEINR